MENTVSETQSELVYLERLKAPVAVAGMVHSIFLSAMAHGGARFVGPWGAAALFVALGILFSIAIYYEVYFYLTRRMWIALLPFSLAFGVGFARFPPYPAMVSVVDTYETIEEPGVEADQKRSALAETDVEQQAEAVKELKPPASIPVRAQQNENTEKEPTHTRAVWPPFSLFRGVFGMLGSFFTIIVACGPLLIPNPSRPGAA